VVPDHLEASPPARDHPPGRLDGTSGRLDQRQDAPLARSGQPGKRNL